MAQQKISLSGVKPTGRPHIGNYFGAMKQFVDLQAEYKSYVFIADYHALNSVQNREEMQANILGIAMDYLAIGLDPEKVTLYKQSDIGVHTELAWIFNCLATMPYLMRAHAFKDAEAKNKEINVGVFDYPLLMAADILLYDADIVPVGLDQKQHVEITRDMARKFNQTFGETFKEPKELILESVKTVPGLDGQKMSKSYNNTIPLFADDETITKLVMRIPTDSKGVNDPKDPDTDTIFALHSLFLKDEALAELRERYTKGGLGYKESKELLAKSIIDFVKPMREKRAQFEKNPEMVKEILKAGAEKAKAVANAKMAIVRDKIGVSF